MIVHVRVSRCRACPCCRVRFRARRGCRRQAPSSEHQSPFACAGTGVAQCTPCCAGPASVCPSEDAVRPATDMFGGTRASDEQQGMPARKADSDCLEQREPCCTCGRVCSTWHTTCIACVAQGTLDVLRVVKGGAVQHAGHTMCCVWILCMHVSMCRVCPCCRVRLPLRHGRLTVGAVLCVWPIAWLALGCESAAGVRARRWRPAWRRQRCHPSGF